MTRKMPQTCGGSNVLQSNISSNSVHNSASLNNEACDETLTPTQRVYKEYEEDRVILTPENETLTPTQRVYKEYEEPAVMLPPENEETLTPTQRVYHEPEETLTPTQRIYKEEENEEQVSTPILQVPTGIFKENSLLIYSFRYNSILQLNKESQKIAE